MKRHLSHTMFSLAVLASWLTVAATNQTNLTYGADRCRQTCGSCNAACRGIFGRCPGCGRQATVCPSPSGVTAPLVDEQGVPLPETEGGPDESMASLGDFAGSFGAAAGPASAAPNMIGDFFGGGYSYMTFGGAASNVSIAGGDRNYKIVESNSPVPADRVFFTHHHFANALDALDGSSLPLDRYNFGIEKTFWDDVFSVEFRIPFAAGFRSSEVVGQGASVTGTEFGNLAMALKAVLLQRQCSTYSAGLGVVFPTGSDSEVLFDDGAGNISSLAAIENEAVHFQPFLGHLWTPNDRLFVQSFAQLDFDTNGNPTLIRGVSGRLQDQSLLFMDVSAGYWLYKNRCARFLKGVAPVVELHYSTTLQSSDSTPFAPTASAPLGYEIEEITNPVGRQDLLNITGGLHFQLLRSTVLTVSGVAPLRRGTDHDFDGEFSIQLNHYF